VELVTIKDLLGHSQIHTTADVYAHVRLRLHQEAIEAMGRALRDDHKPHDRREAGEAGPEDDDGGLVAA